MKTHLVVSVFVAVLATLSVQAADDVYWTMDSQEWQNFNTPTAWYNQTKQAEQAGPVEDDWVSIGVKAKQTSKVKIDTVLPHLKRICLSTANGATTTVEIATGGKVVLTNEWNQILQLNANRNGTSFNAWSELRVTGGTFEFVDNSGGKVRGGIGIGSSSASAAGYAKTVMTAGRISVGNGINVGRADATKIRACYEQSGGRLEFGAGGNGFAAATNGTVAVTGGDVVIAKTVTGCNSSFDGPSLFKNSLFEFGSITLANSERDPEGPRAFVVGEGAVVTGKFSNSYFRINDGTLRVEDGGRLSVWYNSTSGKFQLNAGVGQIARFQMNGGVCKVAYLNLADLAGGVGRYEQTGGTLNATCQVTAMKPQAEPVRLEVSGGTFSLSGSWNYGFPIVHNDCTNSMTFCIRGTPDEVKFLHAQRLKEGNVVQTNRMHHLFQIDPRGLTPQTLDNASSGSGGVTAGRFAAHCSVHPWGGAQLIATNQFVLVHGTTAITDYNDAADYLFDFKLARPDKRLWNWQYIKVGSETTRDLGVVLTNTAAVAHGFRSAQGVSCGYFEVPRIKSGAVNRVSVRLGIVPKGEKTLADIVSELNAKSGCKAVIETAGDCNVRVDLPLERLGDRTTDRKFLFDFTREETPKAFERGEIVTDAVVTALDYEKLGKGFVILLK